MVPIPNVPQPYRFTDPRQANIYRKLQRVAQGLADFFRDACQLAADPTLFASTSHLVGHCCREIESGLQDLIEPIVPATTSPVDPEAKHRAKVMAFLQTLGIAPESTAGAAWLAFSTRGIGKGLHGLAHRDNLNRPRPMQEIDEAWTTFQMMLDVVLEAMETRTLDWHRVADGLLAHDVPSGATIEQLQQNLPNNVAFRSYFFDRLRSWKWLSRLSTAGFFSAPPPPERNEQGGVWFPPWPESRFLARMTTEQAAQDEVLTIALAIPPTDNLSVRADVLDVALALPAAKAATLAPRLAADSSTPYLMLIDDKVARLVVHLSNGGFSDASLDIARDFLEIRPAAPESRTAGPQANIDAHDYGEALAVVVGPLTSAAGRRATDLLIQLLAKAIRVAASESDTDDSVIEDYSSAWRPAIEDHEQNGGRHDIRAVLVEAVRNSTDQLVESDPGALESMVRVLEAQSGSVFKRLSLHLLRTRGQARLDLVSARLIDQAVADDPRLHHEYSLLARTCFALVSEEARAVYLRSVEARPTDDAMTKLDGTPYTAEENERHNQHWRLRRLTAIRDSLPPAWIPRYEQLVAQFGELEHPDFLSYWRTRAGGGDSPRTVDDLRSLPTDELVAFLASWQPSTPAWDGPTIDGLVGTLRGVVAAEPERIAVDADRFSALRPEYLHAVVDGLRDAVDRGTTFAWESILELLHSIRARQTVAEPHVSERLDYSNVSILRLLRLGLQKESSGLNLSHRARIWAILRSLTDDPRPQHDDEADSASIDYVSRSLNTTRGESIHVVLQYALWLRRLLQQASPSPPINDFTPFPEVREVLDAHLDLGRDRSPTTRAAYGLSIRLLAYLDMPWLRGALTRLFPSEPEAALFRDVAWDAYVTSTNPQQVLFNLLMPQYSRAVDAALVVPIAAGRRDSREAVANHLMAAYWHGWIDLDSADGLLQRFYQLYPDDNQAHAIDTVGRWLQSAGQPLQNDVRQRLERVWDRRAGVIEQDVRTHKREAEGYGAWFASGQLDPVTALALLKRLLQLGIFPHHEHAVVQRLTDMFPTYPLDALLCIGYLIDNDTEESHFWGWREEGRPLFENALRHPDQRVVDLARQLINKLGSRGFLDFRDLLS